MATFLALEATTDHPRLEATSSVLSIFGSEGSYVTGTEQLGGLALVLRIELSVDAVRSLDARLASVGIRLDATSRAALERAGIDGSEVVGSLLVRFYAHEADAKIEIPKVPG